MSNVSGFGPTRLTPQVLKTELLSGLTVALALVPEAVAFAFVAGVHPLVGLYAAFLIGLITALIGGRPGIISGATGALAVVMVALPEGLPVTEALEASDRVRDLDVAITGAVANGRYPEEITAGEVDSLQGIAPRSDASRAAVLAAADAHDRWQHETLETDRLRTHLDIPTAETPYVAGGIHDLAGLAPLVDALDPWLDAQ